MKKNIFKFAYVAIAIAAMAGIGQGRALAQTCIYYCSYAGTFCGNQCNNGNCGYQCWDYYFCGVISCTE